MSSVPGSAEAAELRNIVDSTFAEFFDPHDHNWVRLRLLQARAWCANKWKSATSPDTNVPNASASLSDWDSLFASFLWDDASPSTIDAAIG
jgi:hypothetical protein